MKTFLKRSRFYVPAALRLPAKKLSYRFLLSLCLFFLILFSLALEYTGVSVFILLVIQVAFCADILVRCAWKDLLRGRCTFAVLVSMSVVAGFLYCALNTFLTRPLAGVLLNLHVQVSLLLTLALWAQYRMTHAQEKTKIFVKKLDDFLPKSGRLCTEKKTRMVFVNELKPGDRVLVHPGERVPCDGRIVEGATFLDEQLISGNIRSTAKQMGNTVYAGTLNKTQTICVEVETPLASRTIVSVLDAIKNNEDRHNQLPDALEKTAFWLVLLLAAAAAIAYGYALVKQPEADWLHQTGILWLILALGCPVGWLFVAVFPTFFVHYGAKRIGIILNYFDTLQTFVQADTDFLDKTGTLSVGA
jgi:Cu+-exporting ATPase